MADLDIKALRALQFLPVDMDVLQAMRTAWPALLDAAEERDALRAALPGTVAEALLDAYKERDALRAALRDLRRVYDRNVDPFDACAVYDRIDALLREE